MSLAAIAGGLTGYPINHWLVSNHLKHGCMTLPGADGPAPGLGHRSPEATTQSGAKPTAPNAGGMRGTASEGEPMVMNELPPQRAAAWAIGSIAVLVAALWVTNLFVPIHFSLDR